ncbi:type I DNA topoisomerase [Candidatus Uabimicrobium sp. HlEnr_7]|uniref:type I DNA topoisomerase n=1 Tax=Candidatus Uabimicrobium helgolandensis TaxID=3095367 RepID=UPI00355739A3
MPKNLMIVESPAKAKTIEKFLGKDFVVESCYGCIRDLPREKLAVDVEKKYAPTYEVPTDKKKVVSQLKKLAKDSQKIWLATDEDREGEAISWHLCHVLGIEPESAKRIVFHEITKPAILEAIKTPRFLNQNLVNAQQARRILDRLVGFQLSPLLWKKIRLKSSLSAGRVQSVAVRILVEKERNILEFTTSPFFRINSLFKASSNNRNYKIKAELGRKLENYDEARAFLEKCSQASFSVASVQVKPTQKSPSAPFTTSTLQQEASRKLGFSVARTMRVAQSLYESGKITYMRTDSVNLSKVAIASAKKAIEKSYGKQYSNSKQYRSKARNAQEAHEAIRPTYFENNQVEGTSDEQKLYSLIWKRAISSQMSNAQLEKTIVKIKISTLKDLLTANGEVIKFDGFLKVYEVSTDEEISEDSEILPPLEVGQELDLDEMKATQRFTRAPARYTEASLVKKLEELGIGRPSTYAPTMSVIQKRGYVTKGETPGKEREFKLLTLKAQKILEQICTENFGSDRGKLVPTDIGMVVNDFLIEYFQQVLQYDFTARIEKEFDDIAQGEKIWNDVIHSFYQPFNEDVELALKEAKQVTGERKLGVDPKSKKDVFVKIGRYGPMAQIGHVDDEEKPKFAKLRPKQHLATITLEEALELFKLPRKIGEHEGEEVIAAEGRYGPYIKHSGKFVSLGEYDPLKVTLDEAIVLIKQKEEMDAKKTIHEFEEEDIKVLNGPYGPYISYNKRNYKIPKSQDPKKLTAKDCLKIIEEAPEKKTKKAGKKTAAKKTTKKATAKKTTTKKAAAKKTTTKKAAAKKTTTKKTTAKKTTAKKATTKKAAAKKTTTKKAAAKKTTTKKATAKTTK